MADFFVATGCPMAVIANKSDKLTAAELQKCPDRVREVLALGPDAIVMPFSAEKGTNRQALISVIEKYAK